MVKANCSFGGKLLLVLITVIVYTLVLVGGLIGAGFYAYKNVKVSDLLGFVNQTDLVSPEYAQKTVEQFVKDLQADLSGDGLTLQTIADISPKAEEMMDSVLDNLNGNGIVTIDREALFNTPVQELSSSLADIAVVTATLGSLQDTMGFTLPDMPLVTGSKDGQSPIKIYAAVNDNESKTLDKAFAYGDYTYYTLRAEYTEEATELSLRPALYRAEGLTADGSGYLRTQGGAYVYSKDETGAYGKIRTNSDAIYEKSAEGAYFFTEQPYLRTAPDVYEPLNCLKTDATEILSVAADYLYQPLYLADGTLATTAKPDENGRFPVSEEYAGHALYAKTETEVSLAKENLTENGLPKDEFLKNNLVYVYSDGLSGLPLVSGISALSSALDTKTLTLNKVSEYFGISLDSDLLGGVTAVPLAYLGVNADETVQNLEIGTVLGLKEGSNSLLLYLAYGSENNYHFDADGNVVMDKGKPNTIAGLSDALDRMTIGNAVDLGENPPKLMEAIRDWTLQDFSDGKKINGLTLGDVIEIDATSPAILRALENTALGGFSDKIETLTLEDMLGEIGDDNTVLWALKDCTLDSLAGKISTLALQDLFAAEIYDDIYTKVYENGEYLNKIYENTALYALADGKYVSATEVSAWKLPFKPETGKTYYKFVNGAYEKVSEAELQGTLGVPVLYILDEEEELSEILLEPAQLKIKNEYLTKTLYSPFKPAVAENGIYKIANVYCYDVAAQAFRRIDLTPVYEGADENKTIRGYTLPQGYENTALFTYGEVQGIWKYLLVNGNGVEEIAKINDIGTLISNITSNITNRTLREMYNDEVLVLDDASVLDTDIPEVLGGGKLGDQTVNGLLKLTSDALKMIQGEGK